MQISLKAARVNANMTQKVAAGRIGIDQSTLISWESGRTAPKAPQLIELCKVYGVAIDEIFLTEKSS